MFTEGNSIQIIRSSSVDAKPENSVINLKNDHTNPGILVESSPRINPLYDDYGGGSVLGSSMRSEGRQLNCD